MPYYNYYLKKIKTNFSFQPSFRYGVSNSHANVWTNLIFRTRDWEIDKKIKRQVWIISGGKRVSQFNKENPIATLTNTVNTLFWGDNYMKTYENYFTSLNFNKRYENGFRFAVNALYEDRIPLNNTTDFIFFKKDSNNITPNYPYEKLITQFIQHQAFIITVDISIKPCQQYIQYPNRKIPIGSNYPTFSFNFTNGIKNVFSSDVQFAKWSFNIQDDKNFKLAGVLKYKLGIGGFLNANKVFIQDYQHFNGNRTLKASEYVNSFQLVKYYANSTINSFYTYGHVEHHFNGLLTNKIPLFKRLNWNLLAGGNAFYINSNNHYVEIFAGLENVLKLFRVDFVTAYNNGNKSIAAIRIGMGGTLGGSIRSSNKRGRR